MTRAARSIVFGRHNSQPTVENTNVDCMSRPVLEASSPSTLAPALLRWVERACGDVAAIAAVGGLRVEDRDAKAAMTTSSNLAAMLFETSRQLLQPQLGLRLPAELPYRHYDAVALEARAAATPLQVLQGIERRAAHVFPQLEATVSVGSVVRFAARLPPAARLPREHRVQIELYVLSLVQHLCRRTLAASTFTVERVQLSIPRTSTIDTLVDTFATDDIDFGAEHMELTIAKHVAEDRYAEYDPLLADTLLSSLAQDSTSSDFAPSFGRFAQAVEARILAALQEGIDAPAVARSLGMSDRTLQRRLERENVRFSELYDRVREREARARTSDRARTLAEVAYSLGFSDVAAFSRAFKRWTGTTPGLFRQDTQDTVGRFPAARKP